MRVQQSSKNKVLLALGSSGSKISISRLRKHTGLTKAELEIVLEVREREDKIIIGADEHKSVMLNNKIKD